MTLQWRYFVHELQQYVEDSATYLGANPTHQITERHVDTAHPAGISGSYIPDNSFVYMRVDGNLYTVSISGSDLIITPSGGSPVVVGSGTYLPISGGAMAGDLILDHDPIQNLEAVTKQYVDNAISSISGGVSYSEFTSYSGYAEDAFVNISGDTMTGLLTLSADPVDDFHAATKQYVDSVVQSGVNEATIDIQEDGSPAVSGVNVINFTHALDATDAGGGIVDVSVDETELTSVVFLTGNQTITGDKTFTGDISINNLTVTGTETILNTETLEIEDNIFVLNSNLTGAPPASLDAGIEINRGSESNALLYWDEGLQEWIIGISGSISGDDQVIVTRSELESATNSGILVYSGYAEDAFVNISGDQMTGFLTLHADPVDDFHAATKKYVDDEILALSGSIATDQDLLVYSGYAEGAFVNISGDTMIGFLTLHADPTNDFHAATKQYVDDEIDSDIATYSGFAENQFVNIAGDTMTGNLTIPDPSVSGHAANKGYVDDQIDSTRPTVQVDFTTGTDLDVTQNTLALNGGSVINTDGTVYTVNANNITVNQVGYYRVTWNVEGVKTGGSTQRRILQTNINHNGSQLAASSVAGYVRDATNNHCSTVNSYVVEVTAASQTIGIRSQQTGSGGGLSVNFNLSAGHLLIERIGNN